MSDQDQNPKGAPSQNEQPDETPLDETQPDAKEASQQQPSSLGDERPGVKKVSVPPGTKKPAGPSGTTKPAMPPGAKKPDTPPGTKKPALPPSAGNADVPQGAKKPTLPPGAKKAAGPPGSRKASGPSGEKKPTLPPGAKKPAMPPGAKKPAMPPGAKKPAMPPGAKKPAMPPNSGGAGGAGAKKPAMPPGRSRPASPGAKKPAMPPGGGQRAATQAPAADLGGDGAPSKLTRKDFASDQDVRWCPGCGDYAILATVQRLMPDLGVAKENSVFISGIGCSSRFPYYMNTYGLHSIHGRAPAIATGLKASRPELDVWIITGDGDALSIGGNHLIHLMRRNLDVQLLLFNNQIYGLTKGQYSPTSEQGKITKSTPFGSIDHPFNPVTLALGADATFVARSMDRDPKHLAGVLRRAHAHKGAAFVEIYQNCNIFNDGAFFSFTEKASKAKSSVFIEHGKPMIFDEGRKGVRLDGFRLQPIDLTNGSWSVDDCLVYDETSQELANIVGRMFWQDDLPRPFGVFYSAERSTYEDLLHTQISGITDRRGAGDLEKLLNAGDTWLIED